MIKVCDSIMGSGKSESSISYMNEHPEKRFIYITPYLKESKRIKDSCSSSDFVEPSGEIKEFGFSKLQHAHHLIENHRNITSTHQLFGMYTKETLQLIADNGYTLIIDEDVESFTEADVSESDVRLLLRGGYIELNESGTAYRLVDDDYTSGRNLDTFRTLRSHELVKMVEDNKVKYYYWVFPSDLLSVFNDVIIMTYMFDCQDLKYYLDYIKADYVRIGVERTESGKYHFTEDGGYTPDYVKELKDKIHIVDNEKLNAVGNSYHAVSKNWFSTHPDRAETLRKNLYNYFRNIHKDSPPEKKMWGTYIKGPKTKIRGKGFTNSFVVFNQKATNIHSERNILAFCANVFMPQCKKDYLHSLGLVAKQDRYALSTIVQWIWRSAIRNGEEIWIYIPSRRMRTLLTDWIEEVSGGGSAG